MTAPTTTERGLRIGANVATILSALRHLASAVVVLGLPIIGCEALPLLDRAVTVLENVDRRMEDAFRAMAPVGAEAVEKATEAIGSVDGETVGGELTETLRDRIKGWRRDK